MNESYRILLAGNPNVGKSTVFNSLTGLKQHTGNWSGKTVDLASGSFTYKNFDFFIEDLPGTYSLISNSREEEIARNAIYHQNYDLILVVADATCLARNLNLLLQINEITPKVALCVNLLDEAERSHISVDLSKLESLLQIPVIGISAHKKGDVSKLKSFLSLVASKSFFNPQKHITYPQPLEDAIHLISCNIPKARVGDKNLRFLSLQLLDNNSFLLALKKDFSDNGSSLHSLEDAVNQAKQNLLDHGITDIILRDILAETLITHAGVIAEHCVFPSAKSTSSVRRLDKILTSRIWGIPIMIGFLTFLLWITIYGANAPSRWLSSFFLWLKPHLTSLLVQWNLPTGLVSLIMNGIYQTTSWVVSVMLPPMFIFFPLFTLLEDMGFLPRLAFNLDPCFKKTGSCGKQALTMCMGLGCNAVGVTGCRIIPDKRSRLAAMITNCFIPCNGRFSLLITLSILFIGSIFHQGMETFASALFLLFLLLCGITITLLTTALIIHCSPQKNVSSFYLELPPYRKPKLSQILVRSFLDRTFYILLRAVRISAPAGILIWILANTSLNNTSILNLCANFLDPLGRLMGMDGMILVAFLLALPANEIFLPILLMGYLSSGTMIEVTDLVALKSLLIENDWSILTAISVMLFSVLHFPCGTTLLTIKKESGSTLWMFLGFLFPTVIAVVVCIITHFIGHMVQFLF